MLFQILLTLHIVGGFLALITAGVAIFSKTLNLSHQWHIYSGRAYFGGMATVFVTAIPMTFLRPNTFLFLIAIFSFYAAWSGWRLARNRRGTPGLIDWLSAGIMAVTAVAMLGYGLYLLLQGSGQGITLLVFGGIGGANSWADLRRMRAGGTRGQARIAAHLSAMMAATIATLTAFIVTNFTFEPAFVLWLAPTVLIAPLIAWWNRQLQRGHKVSSAN